MKREHVWRRSLMAAFVAFALWEALKHLLLMEVPMFVQHSVSAIIEVGLALVIVLMAVRALTALQDELDQTRETRDKLASALANDLRQPMLDVVESLDELGQAAYLSARARKAVERAVHSVRPLVGMAVELLRVTPPRDEGEELQPVSCPDLLRSAIQTAQVVAAAKQVEIQTDIADTPGLTKGLPHSLFSAFVTLVENAVRATPPGGRVYVACHATGPHGIGIQITDGGIGLSDEEHQVLEGSGEQSGRVVWSVDRPLRSGLQFVAAVIDAHGGDIHAEPSEEQGNPVFVFLPVAVSATPILSHS